MRILTTKETEYTSGGLWNNYDNPIAPQPNEEYLDWVGRCLDNFGSCSVWAIKQDLAWAGYEVVTIPVWNDDNGNGKIDAGEVKMKTVIRKIEK